MSDHRSRNAVEIRRPAAPGVKLVVGAIQRRIAAGALVHPLLGIVLVVVAATGPLRAFLTKNPELLCSRTGCISELSKTKIVQHTRDPTRTPAQHRSPLLVGARVRIDHLVSAGL